MAELDNMRVAIIATDGFEESELTEPRKALEQAGAKVAILSVHAGEIQGFQHFDKAGKVKVDGIVEEADPDSYDALVLPGGALNADTLRVEQAVLSFIRRMNEAEKPMAIICHAPWALISARIVRDRTLTSYHTIEDDVRNAGGHWADHEVVVDRNWVTSRKPADLPAFNREMVRSFACIGRMASR